MSLIILALLFIIIMFIYLFLFFPNSFNQILRGFVLNIPGTLQALIGLILIYIMIAIGYHLVRLYPPEAPIVFKIFAIGIGAVIVIRFIRRGRF
ncbi:hypothetical protein BVY01_05275 [bacterium I07]|nr:hypothetical protein BVY01_05275 [bacterium I07]